MSSADPETPTDTDQELAEELIHLANLVGLSLIELDAHLYFQPEDYAAAQARAMLNPGFSLLGYSKHYLPHIYKALKRPRHPLRDEVYRIYLLSK